MAQLISVIIPVYNVRVYLDQCVESILNQTYENIEILLIDDGSTDGSGDRCDYWAQTDARVITIHQKNQGQAAARNLGISSAKGEYLYFIDSDDFINSTTLFERLLPLMLKDNYSFIQIPYTKAGVKYNDNNNIVISNPKEMFSLWIDGKKITNYLWDKIWKKEIFENLHLKEGIIFEDRYIFVDLLNRCKKVLLTNIGDYYYRTHEGQTTRRSRDKFFLSSMLQADLHILDKMPREFSRLRKMVTQRMFSTFIELSLLDKVNHHIDRVRDSIVVSSISSLRMAVLKLLGSRGYNFIFK